MTEDDRQDVLLSCRFGDIQDIRDFVSTFSPDALNTIQDDHRNSVLHMAAGNGHSGELIPRPRQHRRRQDGLLIDVIAYILPLVDPKLLTHRNHAGSTPLHWAALNRHLDVVQRLVNFPAGPGVDLIDIKNDGGISPLGEAELAGWDEGARWFVQMMKLASDGIKEVREEEESPINPSQAIEAEIQDADGQIARMTINPEPSVPD